MFLVCKERSMKLDLFFCSSKRQFRKQFSDLKYRVCVNENDFLYDLKSGFSLILFSPLLKYCMFSLLITYSLYNCSWNKIQFNCQNYNFFLIITFCITSKNISLHYTNILIDTNFVKMIFLGFTVISLIFIMVGLEFYSYCR